MTETKIKHTKFTKDDVNEQIKTDFNNLYDQVNDGACAMLQEGELVFSSDLRLIPLYFLSIGDIASAKEYI